MEGIISNGLIKAEALRLGFNVCGLASAQPIDEKVRIFFRQWLEKGKQAEMNYMNNHFDKRCNPQLLVQGTRTIVSVALNYYPPRFIPENEYQIAWYAYGKDYHEVMRTKLTEFMRTLTKSYAMLNGQIFCDTAPVLERYWAWKAGIGWIGKNSSLIIPQAGSCFFLGELFLNLEADQYDTPLPDHCGNCTLCLDSCPTKAIEAPHAINANKCINYITIENKGDIPQVLKPYLKHTIYGCNHCQAVCPYNRNAKPNLTPDLQPNDDLLRMTRKDWESLTEEKYKCLFAHSAIKRTKYTGLVRNIAAIIEQKDKTDLLKKDDKKQKILS